MEMDRADPKGLIRESYRIEKITAEECRSIFLDWALSLPAGVEPRAALQTLLTIHASTVHPMTEVLLQGLAAGLTPRRRGGRAARFNSDPKQE